MPRHMGAGLTGYGVSNTLKAKGMLRSDRTATRDGRKEKVTPGFKIKLLDTKAARMDRVVRIEHILGTNHRIADAAERERIVSNALAAYEGILLENFIVTREGRGEKEYILIRERPDPAVAETLRMAAERVAAMSLVAKKAQDTVVELLQQWASASEEGREW